MTVMMLVGHESKQIENGPLPRAVMVETISRVTGEAPIASKKIRQVC